ncbi:AraC-like DNA-binding protein [Brevundimonas alba]|uniref:AraC-like DNA-binding protein n=1 Tax=Brevundimonas alba TaxID=74314 RepID=A0A7X5YM69_9CAUL|nr:AraC family transcriptional regulator [Brevundimonas alba]NJC41716.1 AraC-like DNA-binding protein [Brevundimonas alba]
MIVRPAEQLLDDFFGGITPGAHAAFRDLGRPATGGLRLQVQRLRRVNADGESGLEKDECVAATLRAALCESPVVKEPAPRVIDRARQVLHAFGFERLTLSRIAHEVGVSPTYLTQAFTRAEGQPLYRYQLGLRLNRALVDLPHCNDLSELALDLGFSSHSHFTTAFKASFGLSPSAYRSGWRRADH